MRLFRRLLPLGVLALSLAIQHLAANHVRQPQTPAPYFTYFLALALAVYLAVLIVSARRAGLAAKLEHKGYFMAGVFGFLTALNLVVSKYALLSLLYFPSLDRIAGALVEDRLLLLTCLRYSARLLAFGFFGGAILGFLSGLALGFSKRVAYWLSPIMRLVGPMPSTAWIPIALIVFPSAVSASAFIVGLAVWFPVTLMTSSGISNVPQSYFEVGETLGLTKLSKVMRIGVPAAAPHIFLGLFNGACASFITLVTAELIGAKYGIGWYVNWQREMLSYANVYAGLLVIALTFFLLVSGLFKVRDRFLGWQKGVIKW